MYSKLRLLGSPQIYDSSVDVLEPSTTKLHALLYYLSIKGDWVSRETIADLFWNLDEIRARNNLRAALTKIKTQVSFNWAQALEIENTRLRLIIDNDVTAFRNTIQNKQWAQAQALYNGPLLEGAYILKAPHFIEWLELERSTLHNQWREALMTQADLWEQQGHFDDASALMQSLVEDDMYVEDALLRLLRYAEQSGDYVPALQRYKSIQEHLAQEGLDFSDTLVATAARLERKQQDKLKQLVKESRTDSSNLPKQSTSFIGRDMELVEISDLLSQADCRLLTLTGLGGIGKTRLAIQVAEQHIEQHIEDAKASDGVHFIPLVALQSGDNLAATILNSLSFTLSAGQDIEDQLISSLQDKNMLLVLDNFEHILEAAPLIARILEKCSQLKFLITSREPLNLRWEQCYEVFGLRYPDTIEAENFIDYDAIRLFIRSVHLINSHFQLNPEHYKAVLTICNTVEGMPLGLELAASWTQVFSYQQIAEMLASDMATVISTLKDIPDRHRSLEHVFNHSWHLLSELEQEVLAKVSVFRGGFDKEAAQSVAGASYIALVQLKQKSLVRKADDERFDLHEVIRQGAKKRLDDDVTSYQTTCFAHSQHYLGLVTNLTGAISSSQPKAKKAMETDLDNICEAWGWAVKELNIESLEPSLFPLNEFYKNQGRFQELLGLFDQAEAVLRHKKKTDNIFFAWLLLRKAFTLRRLGDVEKAITYCKESLALWRFLKDSKGIVRALTDLASLQRLVGQFDQARKTRQTALELAKDHNDTTQMLTLLSDSAIFEEQVGNYEQAEIYYLQALETSQQTGISAHYITCLNNLATLYLNTDRFAKADPILQKGLHLAETMNQPDDIPYFLLKLARVANFHERFDEAWSLAQRALVFAREQGDTPYCAKIYNFLGDMSLALKQPAQGYDYLITGLQFAWDTQRMETVHAILCSIATFYHIEQQLEKAVRLLVLLLQQSALVKLIEKDIIRLLTILHEEMPDAQFIKVQQENSSLSIKEFCNKLLNDSTLVPST